MYKFNCYTCAWKRDVYLSLHVAYIAGMMEKKRQTRNATLKVYNAYLVFLSAL